MPNFRWFPPSRDVVSRTIQATLQGAGEVILEESNRTVPLLEGPLMLSGNVEADDERAVISYDTPYAVVQHEDMSFRHAPGRRAKFLQLAMQENSGRIAAWMAVRMAAIFR